MLKMIFRLFRGKGTLTFIVFICLLVMSLDGIAFPYFIGQFTNIMTSGQYSKVPLLLITWLSVWLLLFLAVFLNSFFFGKVRRLINIELKDKVFRRSYDQGNYRTDSSDYIATITADIKQIENDFVDNSMRFIYSILQGIITLIFLLLANWKVGLVFVLLGFIPTIIPMLTSKWLKRGTEEWQQANQRYIKELEDGLQARNLLKRYQAVGFFFKQIFGSLSNEQDKYFTMNIRQRASSFLVSTLYVISTMVALSYGTWVVIQGDITVGMLITVFMAADRVVTPLISLANFYNEMTATEPLLRKVLDDTPQDQIPTTPLFSESDGFLISLRDVSIGFEKDKPIIKKLNLDVARGDRLLIEGSSGAGKSTLIKTMMNELNVLDGTIQYGKSLRGDLADRFAVVEQQPFIFNNTLRYNLVLGNSIPDEKLFEVLEKVGLQHFATTNGLDTNLGSSNHQLSGGELKRFEVARALLYNKEILIVDEALSGLDDLNADLLNQLVMEYPGTVIDIEHRLNDEISNRFNKRIRLS